MAQGKKYNDDIRERAFALLGMNNNCAYVAKALELPYSTVKTWEQRWLREAKQKAKQNDSGGGDSLTAEDACPYGKCGGVADAEADRSPNGYEGNVTKDGMNLVELRQKKKEEFIDDAWRMLGKAQSLLERRLDRAIEDEDKLDALLCEFENIGSEGNGKSLTDVQLRDLYRRFTGLKLEDARALSSILGTLYDKQALAAKEPTQIVDGVVEVKKFEEM